MSILINNVFLNNSSCDVLIVKNRFKKIAPHIHLSAETIIDAKGFAILPPFYNLHTHSAMTLLRGYADDLELFTWLEKHIWPLEQKLREEDVYHGARLAALEMIKSGTVFFNDMYFFPHGTAKAADEMGMRADIAPVLIDGMDATKTNDMIRYTQETIACSNDYSPRVRFSVSPHAIYTVSSETLKRSAELSRKENLPFQIHVSETETEVLNALKEHGLRPVQYLDSLGVLDSNVSAVHCVHLDDTDREILKRRNVHIVHCPISNMKLCSGHFDYPAILNKNISLSLGTDGACSNNNLSMLDEMKFAALRAKSDSGAPQVAAASEIFDLATLHGAQAANIDAGKIAEGMLADCILVNTEHVSLIPSSHLISNMVYSASPECIDTVICDGNILMQNRKVKNEEEIIQNANECYQDLIKR